MPIQITNNLPDTVKRLEQLKQNIIAASAPGGAIQDVLFAAVNGGRAVLQKRIFNDKQDAKGESLGKYVGNKTRLTKFKSAKKLDDSKAEKERKKDKRNFNAAIKSDANAQYTEYQKFRLSKGRQIETKDEQLNGSLFYSIETLRLESGGVSTQISNSENAKIASYQEKQIANIRAGLNANKGNAAPAPIFQHSEAEKAQIVSAANKGIQGVLKGLLQA